MSGHGFVVGIPTFNRYALLDECLYSIRRGTAIPFRVVVIDNGATGACGGGGGYVPAHDVGLNVVTIPMARNTGVAAAWNLLFRLNSEFPLVICNDDVVLAPDALQRLLEAPGDINCLMGWAAFCQKKRVWESVGFYDEEFHPAYFEDCDYKYRVKLAGLSVHTISDDGTIHHVNGTIKGLPAEQTHFFHTHFVGNQERYQRKWGGPPGAETYSTPYNGQANGNLAALYVRVCDTPSDIHQHLPLLRRLASEARHVTELGVREGNSTTALLYGQPQQLVCYDVARYGQVDLLERLAGNTRFRFCQQDVLSVQIDETDLLFIDTRHTFNQLRQELALHAARVRRRIVLHDTVTFGQVGEDGEAGLLPAVDDFLAAHREWSIEAHHLNNNGLMILCRRVD
jgi:hypothetical protein